MGIRDPAVNAVIEALFPEAFVDATATGVAEDTQVLIVDGSLFYRGGPPWEQLGNTWNDYLHSVGERLLRLLRRFPVLETLVYRIDLYGAPDAICADVKDACHAQRYVGARPVDASRYRADGPVAGITSTDTFGTLESRIAFNAMMTHYLCGELGRRLLAARPALEFIVDGGVAFDCVVHAGPMLVSAVRTEAGTLLCTAQEPYQVPEHLGPACRHSEGDIGLGWWAQVYADRKTVVHSCDTDLAVVLLFHTRRMAERLEWAQFPDLFMCKQVNGIEKWIHLKTLYLCVNNVFGAARRHRDEHGHPIEVLSLLLTCGGNDLCEPYGISDEKRASGKDNDGVRFVSVYSAYMQYAHLVGPLFEPTTSADAYTEGTYGPQRLHTHVYPLRVVFASWWRLVVAAAAIQRERITGVKVADWPRVFDPAYMHAQLARACFAIGYYGNFPLARYRGPRGSEQHAGSALSLYGWSLDSANHLLPTSAVHPHSVHCADYGRRSSNSAATTTAAAAAVVVLAESDGEALAVLEQMACTAAATPAYAIAIEDDDAASDSTQPPSPRSPVIGGGVFVY
jgi:hypothetical protein